MLPFAFDPPPAPRRAIGTLAAVLGGERVVLHAERALHWPGESTLFVADVHLGKAAAFRAGGIPLPRGATATDLARLSRLIAETSATRLVVLGDFLHAKAGRVAALTSAFVAWRRQHASLKLVLVRGNHDARAGDPPAEWNVTCVDEPHALPPFLACHKGDAPRTGYAFCGHLHPGVRIHGAAEQSPALPCFVLGARHAILPAFGRFTGLALIARSTDEHIVAIAGRELFALPQVLP